MVGCSDNMKLTDRQEALITTILTNLVKVHLGTRDDTPKLTSSYALANLVVLDNKVLDGLLNKTFKGKKQR